MVRIAVADDRLLHYLKTVAKENYFSIGLIIGQSFSGKDFIIHFAKTPPFHSHDAKGHLRLTNLNDVNEDWVADHARQATRMLPGGMFVLGVFTIALDDILNPFSPKIKSVLSRIHKHLDSQNYLFGNPSTSEKLALNYCLRTHLFSSKSFDVGTSSVKPADFKFLNCPLKWIQINCKYIMDQSYNIGSDENDWPLKRHMGIILDKMSKNLTKSIFLYDGELKDGDDSVESVGKKKISRSNKSGGHDDHLRPLQAYILQLCDLQSGNSFEISDAGNQIKIFGHVASKLWFNPKMPIHLASESIMQDILRSLSTRLEMHWDSLTEEEHGEDVNSVHEPPRRVLIKLPNSSIAISDYLFPGEGADDVKISLEEILDIKLEKDSDVLDIEGQADLTEYYNETRVTESEDSVTKIPKEINKWMYHIGFGVALLVLIISLMIHFIQH